MVEIEQAFLVDAASVALFAALARELDSSAVGSARLQPRHPSTA
jgi:hypothetical protein